MATFPGTPSINETAAASAFVNAVTNAGYVPAAGVDINGIVLDVLAAREGNTVPDALTAAGAASVNTTVTSVVGPASSTYAITLAAPPYAGKLKVITMLSTTGSNSVTLALTNVGGGSAATTATFTVAGHTLIMVSNATKWVVVKEFGVALS